MKYLNYYLIFICFFVTSCDKIITLPIDPNQSKLVIEGNITDQIGPYYVRLTKSINFTEDNIYPGIENAAVYITDNQGIKDTLRHTQKGYYSTNKIKGIPGNTYFLQVVFEGKIYTAESTMPKKVNLDNLQLNTFPFNGETRINIIPVYLDPISLGNNYRFIQKINDTLDKIYHVFNDNLNNGKLNQRPLRTGDQDFRVKPNDSVSIEMQCISEESYIYYYSLNQQSGAGPGGGTTPSNPPNNIKGDALGLFSAHTSQIKLFKIPVL